MSEQTTTDFAMNDGDAIGLFATPNTTGTPERRLLLAVLERAILDFVGNDVKEQETAREWLFGNDEELAFALTFEEVCEALDLDSDVTQKRIMSMPRRGERRVAPWYFAKETQNNNAQNN